MKRNDIMRHLQELKCKGAFENCNDGPTSMHTKLQQGNNTINVVINQDCDVITAHLGRIVKRKYKFSLNEL